ncbi:uncharacterized protein LOC112098440 [Citrus clementina]|uniref:uncharacterized protein LOC112098440 n=1 Tax=Citrus clementina TaxID=85681 RepID=UPI000CED10D8|nr:uncharacterized protein LOC112098440 [Citrus x clementina]
MGRNSQLHVVLAAKLSLDRKTMYMKLISADFVPVLFLHFWWVYGVDTPLMNLTAKTCFIALIMTVLFEVRWRYLFKYFKKEADLENIIQFTETPHYCQIMYDHHQEPPKSLIMSSLAFRICAVCPNVALYVAPLALFLKPSDDEGLFYLMISVLLGFSYFQISFIQPLLLDCDADTLKFIRSQHLVFMETNIAAATTVKEPPNK